MPTFPIPKPIHTLAAASVLGVTACSAPGTDSTTPSTYAVSSLTSSPSASPKSAPRAPAAMTPSGLAAYVKSFSRKGADAMRGAFNPPYQTRGLSTVFAGALGETTRFKSVYYRTQGYREKASYRLSGTGPLFSLPRRAGPNAALAMLTYSGGPAKIRQEDLMLLVQDSGKSAWRLATMTELPYPTQLPTPAAGATAPTRAQERAATKFVDTVIRYLEKGTIPKGPKMGVAPYEWRQRIERAGIGGPVTVDVSRLDTGVKGVGPGAPITIIPVKEGILGVAQLIATVTARSGWAPGGEGDTDLVYQQRLGGDRSRTRDSLAIAFVVPDSGDPAVIGGDLGLMLPR